MKDFTSWDDLKLLIKLCWLLRPLTDLYTKCETENGLSSVAAEQVLALEEPQ